MSDLRVPLNAPDLGGLERQYLLQALDSGWITSGKFVERFEEEFAAFAGRRYAVTCCSGTAALWLAVMALDVPQSQRVVTCSYTCDSVGNAVLLATRQPPLLIDCEFGTWTMRATELEEMLRSRREVAAVICPHTYGVPAEIDRIEALCREHGVRLIEDASEAHGATLANRPVGAFGDMAVFSCRGEKLVGAGQMGVVVTDDPSLAARVRRLANNGLPTHVLRYWSVEPGLNLMTSNLLAALGLAQLHRVHELIAARREVQRRWRALFAHVEGVEFQALRGDSVAWLTGLILYPEFCYLVPQDLGLALRERGVETRPGFVPLHRMPAFLGANPGPCSVSELLYKQALILPSGPRITEEDQQYVFAQLLDIIGQRS